MLDFLKRREKLSRFPKKYADRLVLIYTDRFEVIHFKCRVRMYLGFVFPKGQYESKYGSKSDSMKKAEKQNNPNRSIYCDVKSTLNVSVSITIIRTLISGKLFTQ